MLDRIIDIIREQLNIDDVEITEDTSFKDDLGVDSLDLLELVMAFEEEYSIELDPEELEGIQTVGDVMEFIKKYKLEPKCMQLVYPFKDKEPNMVLIESTRGGRSGMKILKPLIIYKQPGVYTDDIYDMYGY